MPLTYKFKIKYSIGDEVRFTDTSYGSYMNQFCGKIPEEDNKFRIDAYEIKIDSEGVHIQYCFHAYMNKYFEYHQLVDEETLEPIGEAHPQTVEFDTVDCFGNNITFGDIVYYGIYATSRIDGEAPSCNWSIFKNRGAVTGFEYAINIFGRYQGLTVNYKRLSKDITETAFYEHCSGGECGYFERNTALTKTLPDTAVEDIATVLKKSHSISEWGKMSDDIMLDWLGIRDEVMARYESLKTEPKKASRKVTPKKTKKNIKSIVSNLSDEEKAELLKLLQK